MHLRLTKTFFTMEPCFTAGAPSRDDVIIAQQSLRIRTSGDVAAGWSDLRCLVKTSPSGGRKVVWRDLRRFFYWQMWIICLTC